MAYYRKRPVVIEAVQLTWQTWQELCDFADVGKLSDGKPEGGWVNPKQPGVIHHTAMPPRDMSADDAEVGLAIPTLEGLMTAFQGDWIIKGVAGELYPCKPDIFEQTYETVGAGAERPSKHEFLMRVAELTAERSTCGRLQVGAVVSDWAMEQLAVGFNGGPKGGINECRHPKDEGACGCIHAEINALLKANFVGNRRAFLTVSPCVLCAVALVNAKVSEVYYRQRYRDEEGLRVLRESNVRTILLPRHHSAAFAAALREESP